jgi:hypothetical protein
MIVGAPLRLSFSKSNVIRLMGIKVRKLRPLDGIAPVVPRGARTCAAVLSGSRHLVLLKLTCAVALSALRLGIQPEVNFYPNFRRQKETTETSTRGSIAHGKTESECKNQRHHANLTA